MSINAISVIVCGGRSYNDRCMVNAVLDRLNSQQQIVRIITGGATGADSLATDWAQANGINTITYAPEWQRWGKAAGPIRNQTMLEQEKPEIVVAFPGGKGTRDMIQRASRAGVKVQIIEEVRV